MSEYWSSRQHMAYYRKAVALVQSLGGQHTTLVDIGGNVSGGCRYLSWLPRWERTSIELNSGDGWIDSVTVIFADFEHYQPDCQWDVAMCLQCLEHLSDPKSAMNKLESMATRIVVSVPHVWSSDQEPEHLQDPIGIRDLLSWTSREPLHIELIENRILMMT